MADEQKILSYARVGPTRRRRLAAIFAMAFLAVYVLSYGVLRATHVLLRGTGYEYPREVVESESAVINILFWPPRKLEEAQLRSVWRPHP